MFMEILMTIHRIVEQQIFRYEINKSDTLTSTLTDEPKWYSTASKRLNDADEKHSPVNQKK